MYIFSGEKKLIKYEKKINKDEPRIKIVNKFWLWNPKNFLIERKYPKTLHKIKKVNKIVFK